MKTRLLFMLSFICTAGFAQTTNPLHEKAQAILACFTKGDYAGMSKYFDETMKRELPPAKLKEAWNTVNQQAGTYTKSTTVADSMYQGFRVVYITCIFQNAKLKMRTVFDKNDKVAGLWFAPDNGPVCSAGFYEKSKIILACFEKEDYAGMTKYFDETMKKQLPPEKLKEVWNMINQQAGMFIKPSTMEDATFQQYRIVYTICIFQNAKLKLKTVFNSECQISGLFFVPENAPKP